MHAFNSLQDSFQKYLESNPFNQSPEELYLPVDYILKIGGKRIRPLLVLMSYNLYQDDIEVALPAAYAIEIFHNFSLLHDDIMDNAPLRRGQPAVHEKYGINAGILSGDVMLIYAYDYLMRTEAEHKQKLEMIQLFNQSAIEVCEGQQMDMNFETRMDVEINEYLKMIELKTAALLGSALSIGALVGGATAEDVQQLNRFGRQLGIAFQLQDDILDTYGDPEKFGKKVGGDIAQNKKTYLLLRAMQDAEADTLDQLTQLLEGGEKEERQKIEAVTAIYNQLNIRDKTAALQEFYTKEAFLALTAVSCPPERKEVLKKLAENLLGRES